MSNTPSLLPCPFCGAPAHGYAIAPHSHSPAVLRLVPELPDHPGSYVIEGQCACGSGLIGATESDVTERWNRRTPQQEVQEPSHRETVDVVGVRSNGEHVNLEKIAMPPRMKAREIAIEQFGSFKDDDGSDAEMCFGALEYFLEWLIQQGWSKAPQPAPAPLSESEYKRGYRDGYERRDAEVRGALV